MRRGRGWIFTAAQRAEMWRKYKAGESILGIGQALDRSETTVHRELQYTRGHRASGAVPIFKSFKPG